MMKRPLGSTGLRVSPLGLGTVKLGRNEGVKYPQSFRIPDDREARALLDLARDLGINLIDTAPAYGNSEERVGKLLRGQLPEWVVCTKVGEEFENGQSRFDFSPEHLRGSVERSLRRLHTDCLDLVLLHSDGNDEHNIRVHGVLDSLQQMKQDGLLRGFGMSTKSVAGGLLALETADVVMITLNLNERDEAEVAQRAAELERGVLVKKALASGHVVSGDPDQDPVQASFDYIFAQPGVHGVIVGTITPAHLRHNVACAEQALARR